jgi:hypothetical protein
MKFIAAAALLAAQNPGPPVECVPQQEVADLTIVLLPAFIDAAAAHCASHLGTGSFLGSGGGRAMAERLRAEAGPRRESAARGIRRMVGDEVPRGLSGTTMLNVLSEGMIGQAVTGLDAVKCRHVDKILRAAAPLPPANIGDLIAAIGGLAFLDRRDSGRAPPVCPA